MPVVKMRDPLRFGKTRARLAQRISEVDAVDVVASATVYGAPGDG
jgi:hypothetical protein